MVLKRVLAYFIDYFVILIYAGLLLALTLFIYQSSGKSLESLNPLTGNVISFLTLTFPVFLYFYFYEGSSKRGTLGKQVLKIIITNNTKRNVLIRVFFKIIPWEIAHFGIHWSVFYTEQGMDIPLWNWIVLIFPQVIIVAYFISILTSKGKSSIYDNIAGTQVIKIIKSS